MKAFALALLPAFLLPHAFAQEKAASRTPAGVVRSKEWKVRRSPRREEEFIGEVRYHGGPTRLSCDWALFQQEGELWQARGRIVADHELSSGEKLQARRGERAAYEQKSGKGWLSAAPGELLELTHAPPQGPPDFGRAERLEWEADREAWAKGRVHAWGPMAEAWSDQAHWKDSVVELSGSRPVLHRKQGKDWTGAVKADRIALRQGSRELSADGSAVGWFQLKEKAGEKRP